MMYALLRLAGYLLVDGEAVYLSEVAKLEAIWDALPGAKGSTYPFSFPSTELEEIVAEAEGEARGIKMMCAIREDMGELFPDNGVVSSDQYEEALGILAQMKDLIIGKLAVLLTEQEREEWQKMWPFGT